MSSSPPSNTRPSDATLEQALQYAIQKVYKSGNLENLTVRRIRKSVESDLNLEEDFFKTDDTWTSKSKLVIQAEVDAQAEAGETSSLPTLSQHRTSPPKPQDQHRKPRGTKRASTEKAEPKKRQKKNDSGGEESAREEEASKMMFSATAKAKPRNGKRGDSEAEELTSEAVDFRAESDYGNDAHGEEVTSAKDNGSVRRETNSERNSAELQPGNDEEEGDVKPTKSRRNPVKGRGGRNNHITEKPSSKEGVPKKPGKKAKPMKGKSSSSNSLESEKEADTTPSQQARVHSSVALPDELGEQPLSESELSELINEPPTTKQSRESEPVEPKTEKTKPKPAKSRDPPKQSADPDSTKAEQSDSSMSVLIDAPLKPKRNRKSNFLPPKPHPPKSKKPTEPPSSPSSEEIKRLQSQLVKCGIRKMWFKELSPYPTPKSKIKHLKELLADAGMTGRFSEAKAEQIKEERELRADLEAVQEGEKKWGKVEEGEGGGRGKRGLAKGFEGLGFLNDDDGEETD